MEAVSLWHDTTMWNEGFENAREPLTTVNLNTFKEAQTLIKWVEDTHGLMVVEGYTCYLARRDAVVHGQPAVTVDEAKKVFDTAIQNADYIDDEDDEDLW